MAPIRSTVWDSKLGHTWPTWRDGSWWEETPSWQASDADALSSKALAGNAEAVVVWGFPSDAAYVQIVEKVKFAQGSLSATPFTDPYKGEVGTAVLFRRAN